LKKVVTYAIDFIALEWAATCILKPDSIWQGTILVNSYLSILYSTKIQHFYSFTLHLIIK
jgi:hypothetical protein